MKCVFKPHSLIGFDGGHVEGTHADFDLINAPAPRNKPRLFQQRRRDTVPACVLRNAELFDLQPKPSITQKVRFAVDLT